MKNKQSRKQKISQRTYYNVAAGLFSLSGVIWLVNPSSIKVLSAVYFFLAISFFALGQSTSQKKK